MIANYSGRMVAAVGWGLMLITVGIGCSPGGGPTKDPPQSTVKVGDSNHKVPEAGQQQRRPVFERLQLASQLAVQFHENPDSKQQVVPQLRQLLDDPDWRVRLAAADAIVQTGEELDAARDVLLEGLGRERGYVASGRALNQIGESAMPAVLKALASEDTKTRRGAVFSLGMTWSIAQLDDRITALLKVLSVDREAEVRGQAAVAVATLIRQDEVGSDLTKQAIEALTAALADPSPVVRSRTVFAIGTIGHGAHQAIPALIFLLGDEDSEIRGSVANTLGILASPHQFVRGRIIIGDGGSEGRASPELAAQAIAALIATLSDVSPTVRTRAARGISYIGAEAREAVPALTAQLEDAESEPRWWAATALAKLEPDSAAAIAVLNEAVADGNSGWKSKASRLLKELSTTISEGDSTKAGSGK